MADYATPVGIIVALVAILGSMVMEGGNPATLISPTSIILVIGGTIGAAMAGTLLSDVKGMMPVVKNAITSKVDSPEDSITRMVAMAETARRDGLLALEEAAQEVEDPFFRKAVEMAVDGIDGEQIRSVLEKEIASMQARHRQGAKFFHNMGGYAPTIGIIGTVIGLIHVLGNLSSPEKLGSLIGAAFTATLWGVMSANVAWIPIENKLKRLSEIEVHNKLLILDGILAIQAGDSPRMVEQHLLTYVAPKDRVSERGFKAA
ncbi:MAG TPA: flagellar motor protein [Acidimicrobiales bacterium]|nr:flagellar motor protein [Acidimicrobiales bacterium]